MFVPYQWPQVNETNMKNNVNAIVWNEVVNVFNSLAPGGFDYSFKLVHFKLISAINILSLKYFLWNRY